MNILRIALLLVAMSLFPVLAIAEPSTGRLVGIVSDINDARIRGATVAVTSESVTLTTTTNEQGAYELDLPSGRYRITVARVGFCPSRRAAFLIKPSMTASFNFTLIPCAISNDLKIVEGQYEGETDRYRDPFKEEVFPIKQASGAPLELLVRYATRRRDGKFLEYSGTVVSYDEHAETPTGYTQGKKSVGVIATYDWLMIRADKLLFEPRTLRLKATGNIVLDDGKQETRGTTIEVGFSSGKPIIKRVQ